MPVEVLLSLNKPWTTGHIASFGHLFEQYHELADGPSDSPEVHPSVPGEAFSYAIVDDLYVLATRLMEERMTSAGARAAVVVDPLEVFMEFVFIEIEVDESLTDAGIFPWEAMFFSPLHDVVRGCCFDDSRIIEPVFVEFSVMIKEPL
jgi:hypothetical protein